MGFAKLREWVGTVTGKGDRWGRDRLGRSEPAFLSTTALPHLPARREADFSIVGSCCDCCETRPSAGCFLRPVPDGESAGCVRLQWLVLRAVCLPAIPTAHQHLAPVQHFACPRPFSCFVVLSPVSCHVRQDHHLAGPAVCLSARASSLPATKLSRWQLQHGPAVAARAPVHY